MKIQVYKDKSLLAEHFSAYLERFIAERRVVHLALSGGSTPKIIFETLSIPGKYKIDWNKVHLYWGDERCVPPTDDESNYKMTREYLLYGIDIPEANIHRILGEAKPELEAIRYSNVINEQLPKTAGVPVFDLILLGMGEDGHTASIFPHEIALWDAEDFCEVANHPVSGQQRITFTGKIINNAKVVAFLVTGVGKKDKVAEIINHKGNFSSYPASLVAPVSGSLLWFLDEAAASGL